MGPSLALGSSQASWGGWWTSTNNYNTRCKVPEVGYQMPWEIRGESYFRLGGNFMEDFMEEEASEPGMLNWQDYGSVTEKRSFPLPSLTPSFSLPSSLSPSPDLLPPSLPCSCSSSASHLPSLPNSPFLLLSPPSSSSPSSSSLLSPLNYFMIID